MFAICSMLFYGGYAPSGSDSECVVAERLSVNSRSVVGYLGTL